MKLSSLVGLAVILGSAVGYGLTWAEFNIQHQPAYSAVVESAGHAGAADKIDPADGPVAFVPEDTYNWGFMESNSEAEHEFLIINKGKAPLTLEIIGTSCKCIISNMANDKKTLEVAPGDETRVNLSWHTKGKVGDMRQSADLKSNDPLHPQIKLVVEGNVTQTAIVNPVDLVFTSLSTTEETLGVVRVYSVKEDQFELKDYKLDDKSTADKFEFEMSRMERDQFDMEGVKDGWLVKVKIKPGLPLGPLNQKLRIESTLSSLPEVIVTITGNVSGDVNIAGRGWQPKFGALVIGFVTPDEPVSKDLQLIVRGEHRHDIQFEVEKVEPDFLQAVIGERIDNGGTAVQVPLTITIPKGCQPCNHMGTEVGTSGEVMLKTNHPDIKQVRIKVNFAVAR